MTVVVTAFDITVTTQPAVLIDGIDPPEIVRFIEPLSIFI